MIPAVRVTTAGFSRRGVPAALVALLAACGATGETTMSRLARERDIGAAHARAEQHRRELARLEQEGASLAAQVLAAKALTVRRASELRAVVADLHHQLGVLQTAEQDLQEARARGAAIETELQPLRALELALREQERLRDEVSGRITGLAAEVERLTAEASRQETALRPRLDALQRQIAAAQAAEAALANAGKALAEALAVLSPPPPPAEKK